MNKQHKVAVLMGGSSPEREVSLMSGEAVLQALQQAGIDAIAFDPAQQDIWQLKSMAVSQCFNVLHGDHGEDGRLQGALEWLDIPYTGSGVQASAMAMSKIITKIIWRAAGLPVAKDMVLQRGQYAQEQLADMLAYLGLPLMVKPNTAGSSIGITRVDSAEQLDAALQLAFSHDNTVLCEQFIEGKELTCAILGSGKTASALPLIWIEAPKKGGYNYENKYFTDEVKYHFAFLDKALEAEIMDLALCAYQELGCRGWGRVDIMLDANQRPYLLEMNTAPGMTSHSLVPKAAATVGKNYTDLCVEILQTATTDSRLAKTR